MDEQKIKDIAIQVFKEQLGQSQYKVTSVPAHSHNQTDSPRIPPTSVTNFAALPAGETGVLSKNNISISFPPYGIIYPIPVIRAVGVGPFSAFNGGDAPLGSMIVFMGPAGNELWIMLEDLAGVPTWYGTGTLTAL